MSARPAPVAAIQPLAHDRGEFERRWPSLLARIAGAAESGARLVVVPEGTVPSYVIGTDPIDPQLLERAARDVIAVAARTGATIVYGGARHDDDGVANSAYVVTPDGIAGFADKCFLWHFDRRWFRAARALEPVDTPVGRLGIFICADGRIPTIASTLVERGAEILVVPTAWVTSGRDPRVLENLQADLMIAVRARENGVPIVVANKVGIEARSVAYCGKSQIVDAAGDVVALASQSEEATLTATIALGAPPARPPAPPVARLQGPPLPQSARIAFATAADDELRALAAVADAALVADAATPPPSADVATVDDAAMLDPRALVAPRLDGVRLFVWRAGIEERWIAPFARTRAAELRAYVLVHDAARRRSFAVDPDGAIVAGTFDGFELAAFGFDRRRTDVWTVAPSTDVREGLQLVSRIAATVGAR